jgi:hypothetical protein
MSALKWRVLGKSFAVVAKEVREVAQRSAVVASHYYSLTLNRTLDSRRPDIRFMVWMLMVGARDPVQHLRVVGVSRSVAGYLCEPRIPRYTTLVTVLIFGRRTVRLVERTDKNTDVLAIRIVECQRGAAVAAVSAAPDIRTAEIADCTACHAKCRLHYGADDRERAAYCLLAHSAVTYVNILRLLIERISDGTTLAASRQNDGLHNVFH